MKVILEHFHFCYHFNIAYDSIKDMPTRFSSPVRHFHQNSPFSHDEGSWIILKFGEFMNLSDARRAFRLKFFPKNTRDVPRLKPFQRLFRCFETSEATCLLISRGRHRGRRCLPVYWSEGPVAGGINLEILKTVMWPSVRVQAARRGFWFQQDGAGARHTRSHGFPQVEVWRPTALPEDPAQLATLQSGFVLPGLQLLAPSISRSRGANAGDPRWTAELKPIVEGFAGRMDGDQLRRMTRHTRRHRAELCFAEGEGTSSTSCRRTKGHSWLSFVLCQMSSISHSNRVLFMC